MTTFSTPCNFEMDFSHLDDKMEIGTSPQPPVDDFDLDFDNVRQQSIDRSMADDTEAVGVDTDLMQADIDNIYNDDDMLDDETMQPSYDDYNGIEDFNMESYNGTGDQDEEILYDEEGASVDMAVQQDFIITDGSIPVKESNQNQLGLSDEARAQEVIPRADGNHTNIILETSEESDPHHHDPETNVDEYSALETTQETITSTDVIDFAAQRVTQDEENLEHEQAKVVEDANDALEENQISEQASFGAPKQQTHTVSQDQSVISEDVAIALEDAEKSVSSEHENQSGASVDPLHPVAIVYLGQEMSLFPPMADDLSATFFVSDSSLAFEPIEKLLVSCREILGESLEHDDELVLDIPALGLHICEDSKYASQLTFSQILEVYLSLSHNESIQSAEPLYCTLSSRVCLASQYAYLASSAAEGKTYSEIALEHADSPDTNSVEGEADDQGLDISNHGVDVEETTSGQEEVQEASVKLLANEIDGFEQSILAVDDLAQSPKTHETAVDEQDDEEGLPTEIPSEQAPPVASHSEPHIRNTSQPPATTSNADLEDAIKNTEGLDENQYQGGEKLDDDNDDEDNFSTSSHTIEGEPGEGQDSNRDAFDEVPVDDEQDASSQSRDDYDNHEVLEDLFKEDDSFNFLDQDQENIAQSDPADIDVVKNGDIQEAASTNINDQASHDQLDLKDSSTAKADTLHHNGSTDELDFLGMDEISSDMVRTPSKLNGNKRKALDEEEELDFLDISTPEPKRTRAL